MREIDQRELQPLKPVQERRPENRKMEILSGIVTIAVIVVVVLFRQAQRTNHRLFEEPYPIRVGSVTVIPGETTVEALSDAGYELAEYNNKAWNTEEGGFYYAEIVDVTAAAKPNAYYMMTLLKEGEECAVLQIYNWTREAAPVKNWTIGMLEVSYYDEEAEQAALVNIPFAELTKERVSQSVETKPDSEGNGKYTWRNGAYVMSVEFADDMTVERIRSEYDAY